MQDFDTNNNNRIDDPEFFDIIDAWIAGQIDDSTFFQAIDLWVSQTPISAAGMTGKTLRLDAITLAANPANHIMTFKVSGQGIASIDVKIFDMSGREIFTQATVGTWIPWKLKTTSGSPVSNGVYLYVVTARGAFRQMLRSEVRKLMVVR